MSRLRWVWRLVALVAVVIVTGACEVRSELTVRVADDGTGEVGVAVALDDVAAARLAAVGELQLDDLRDAGWQVTGPAVEDDGFTWIRVTHPLTHPDDLGPLVAQVVGDDVFRDFSLARDDAFAESVWRFRGTVDFSAGDAALADPDVDAALAGAGVDADALALVGERFGSLVDDQLRFRVALQLPGEVASNAPTRADNGAVWQPRISERAVLELRATGTVQRTERLVWAGVAALAGLVLVLFVVVRLTLWRRGRAAPPSDA